MIDIENSTLEELDKEYDYCMDLWGEYSCGCFGFYIDALQKAIIGIRFKDKLETY